MFLPLRVHAQRTLGRSRKVFAKANRGFNYFGNALDLLLRNCQDGQTNGIPVGPDTSLVIAELLLADVDRILHSKRIKGIRYMDDYELIFSSEKQALEARSQLQEALLNLEIGIEDHKDRNSIPAPVS